MLLVVLYSVVFLLMGFSKELEKSSVLMVFLTGSGNSLEAKKILLHFVKVSPDYPTFNLAVMRQRVNRIPVPSDSAFCRWEIN